MTIDVRTTPAPIETVTPIKPSEAIRFGCLTTVQVFGISGEGAQACALTAAEVGGYRGGFLSWGSVYVRSMVARIWRVPVSPSDASTSSFT